MSFQASLGNIQPKTGKTPDTFRHMAAEKDLLTPLGQNRRSNGLAQKGICPDHGY